MPPFQRAYSWESEQIGDFWSDLEEAHKASVKRVPEYFLGTIVLTPGEKGEHVVIDGQQRLPTTTMLLAAIRNVASERQDQDLVGEVRQYLSSLDLKTREHTPRLRLNREDDDFFRGYVVESPGSVRPAPGRESHRRIQRAFDDLNGRLRKAVLAAGDDWPTMLGEWVSLLASGALVITLTVPDEGHAYRIFETLNDRGLDLTTADLLKNYLFGQAGDRLDSVQQAWSEAQVILASPREGLFKRFLRHYWIGRYGLVRDRELYDAIRKRIKGSRKAYELADGLRKGSRLYSAIVNRDHEYWNEFGAESQKQIDTLFRFGLEQNRPLLLAAMERLDKPELKRILSALVSWSVRGLVVGGIGVQDVYNELLPIIPSDETFRSAFSTYSPPSNQLARYYLLAIEHRLIGDKEPEFVPNADADQVNLEHVLAKNAVPGEWPRFAGEQLSDWAGRLGNQVLLKKSDNEKIGNKPFGKKREVFSRSKFKLTSKVGRKSEWSPAAIDQRQGELATMAVVVWPRDPGQRRPRHT